MSLIARWSMNEGEGTDVVDDVGGFDGVLLDSGGWTTDPEEGTVISFNGANEIQLPNSLDITSWTELTLLMRLKFDQDASSYGRLFGLLGSSSFYVRGFFYRSSGSEGIVINGTHKNIHDYAFTLDTWYTLRIRLKLDYMAELNIDGLYSWYTNLSGITSINSSSSRSLICENNLFMKVMLSWVKLYDVWDYYGNDADANTIRVFDTDGSVAPMKSRFYATDTGLVVGDFTMTAKCNGVTETISISLEEIGDGWYEITILPNKNGQWEVFAVRTSTGESFYIDFNETTERSLLDRPKVTRQNNYSIPLDSGLAVYNIRIDVDEITKAVVYLDRPMSYTVSCTPESDQCDLKVKKGTTFFEVFGSQKAVLMCNVIINDRLNDAATRIEVTSPPITARRSVINRGAIL